MLKNYLDFFLFPQECTRQRQKRAVERFGPGHVLVGWVLALGTV